MRPRFGKIIDVSGATSGLTVEQVERIAKMLCGNADEKRVSWHSWIELALRTPSRMRPRPIAR